MGGSASKEKSKSPKGQSSKIGRKSSNPLASMSPVANQELIDEMQYDKAKEELEDMKEFEHEQEISNLAEKIFKMNKTKNIPAEQLLFQQVKVFMNLFAKTEILGDIFDDDEIIFDKIKDISENCLLLKSFGTKLNLLKDIRSGKDVQDNEIQKLAQNMHNQKGIGSRDLPLIAFSLIMQGFRLAYNQDIDVEENMSFGELLEKYLDFLTEGEGNKQLAELVLTDLSAYEGMELSERIALAQKSLKDQEGLSWKNFSYLLTEGPALIFDAEAKGIEFESIEQELLNFFKLSILKEINDSLIDFEYCLPTQIRGQYFSLDYFPIIGGFSLGYLKLRLSPNANIRQYQVNITVDNIPQGYVAVDHVRALQLPRSLNANDLHPNLNSLAKLVSKALGQVDLHYDKDVAVISQRLNRLYYSNDKKQRLFEIVPTSDHNVILAFARPGTYTDDGNLKIVVTSDSRGNHLEMPEVLLCLSKQSTIEDLLKEILMHTRSEKSSKNQEIIDALFKAFTASQVFFPTNAVKSKFTKLKDSGVITIKSAITDMIHRIRQNEGEITSETTKGESPVDLIVKLALEDIMSLTFL
jgi:hypothetical protein